MRGTELTNACRTNTPHASYFRLCPHPLLKEALCRPGSVLNTPKIKVAPRSKVEEGTDPSSRLFSSDQHPTPPGCHSPPFPKSPSSLTRYALPASTQLTSFPAEPVSRGTGPTAEASSILLLLWVSQGDRHVWGQSRSPRFLFWRPGGESPQTSECPRGAGGQQTLLTW